MGTEVTEKTAFVIGNGTSRKDIKLHLLKKHGSTYGCNALYRDFAPDYLVAVDYKMIKEIYDSGYYKNHEVWVAEHESLRYVKDVNYLGTKKWSSGPSALFLATGHFNSYIYMIGFDFIGLENDTKMNNMYADTKNYKRSVQKPIFYRNWLQQTIDVVKNNNHISFIRVGPEFSKPFPNLEKLPNYSTISIENFKKYFN